MPSFVDAPRVVAGAGGSTMPLENDMVAEDVEPGASQIAQELSLCRGVWSTPRSPDHLYGGTLAVWASLLQPPQAVILTSGTRHCNSTIGCVQCDW